MDPIRLAVTAMGAGTACGLAVVCATVYGVDLLRSDTSSTAPQTGAALYLLFFGTVAGILAAGLAAWRLLRPVLSTYRRGGLAMVSALATVIAMLLCIPVHQLAGRPGLVGLGVTALLVSGLLARAARATAAP